MTHQEAALNAFLVNVFNDVLRLEEASLYKGPCKNISVTEMHVLEAVEKHTKDTPAYMTDVAAALGVTSGTLTVAVKTLEQKGYLTRARAEKDKRRVTVALTAAALPALKAHTAFHEGLVGSVAAHLSAQELDALTAALASLHKHFKQL